MRPIEADFQAELVQIQAESIGWVPLQVGAYLYVEDPDGDVINVASVPDAGMAGINVVGGVLIACCCRTLPSLQRRLLQEPRAYHQDRRHRV